MGVGIFLTFVVVIRGNSFIKQNLRNFEQVLLRVYRISFALLLVAQLVSYIYSTEAKDRAKVKKLTASPADVKKRNKKYAH
jgi:hypothetical protein